VSEDDVQTVFGPQWVQDTLALERGMNAATRRIVLVLRRRLIAQDPTLPNEYDGTAWQKLEEEWQ
jgi:hypothetical protein